MCKTDRIVDVENCSDNVGRWLLPLDLAVSKIYLKAKNHRQFNTMHLCLNILLRNTVRSMLENK